MVAVADGPQIVVRVDAQSVRMGKESGTEAPNEVALRFIFGEYRFGSLE